MSNTILFSQEGAVATISLNRPKAFNSFNREMALALIKQLEYCAKQTEIRAILLTAEGKAFCAGQDLADATSDSFSFEQALNEHYNPIIKLIRTIEKPIVCAVNGVAAGAGANLAFACDITIAAEESARFVQAFSKIGLVPDSGGTFTVPRLVGLQKATAMMMLNETIDARNADRLGLIYRYYPDSMYLGEARQLAIKLSKMPTKALGMIKKLLNASNDNSLEQQLELEGKMQITASQTYDYKEGVQAFLDKRKPVFKGK